MTSYRADKPKVDERTDRQTDRQTDKQTDGRTDGGNDITPSAEVPRGKNDKNLKYIFFSNCIFFFGSRVDGLVWCSCRHDGLNGLHLRLYSLLKKENRLGKNNRGKGQGGVKREGKVEGCCVVKMSDIQANFFSNKIYRWLCF